jgi:DNA-binding NtrC family response regulator
MQNKKELEQIKELLGGGAMPEEKPTTITISQPEKSVRKPIEAEDVDSSSLRIDEGEKELIRRALEVTGGNRKEAAERLGFSERTLYRKIKEYDL